MLNGAKSLTTIAGLKKAKEKVIKSTSQIGKEPYENHSDKNRVQQNAKKNNKTRRRRVLILVIQEGLTKSSQKQHLENTDKWHLCKAGSFSYGESPWTPPLEGTSLHR